MKIKILILFILLTCWLIYNKITTAQTSIQNNNSNVVSTGVREMNGRNFQTYSSQQYNSSSQDQRTAITLNASALRSPCVLSISTNANAQLVGEVTVNGVVVQSINKNRNSINLSPYLTKGIKTIEISGTYNPASSLVSIEFSGPGTQVTQQTSNNGVLRQTLIINVY